MKKYMDTVEERILKGISQNNMDELLKVFSRLDRLSGEQGEREAIDYLKEKLEEYGVACHIESFESFLSDPISASLCIAGKLFPSKTRSFSADCPEGVTARLVYAPAEGGILFDAVEIAWRRENIEGCIVVSEGGGPQHVDRAAELGAVGLIHVWPSKEVVIHEMISTPIWGGTPTPENHRFMPRIPEISVNNEQGQEIIEWARKGEIGRISTSVRTGIKKLQLLVAEIKGESPDFVLFAGHIDSWHEGITDNAVGNALCLELARVFHEHRGNLKRGVRFCWWPGHSNGRYAGSTWYADHHIEELRNHCIGYINSDSPGSKHGVIPLIRSTLLEEPGFFNHVVKEVAEIEAEWAFPIRAGDNSFWGSYIPFHVMLRDKPGVGHDQAHVGGSGGGWWWHSEEDTYDKADLDILLRDAQINAAMVYRLLQREILPVNLMEASDAMKKILQENGGNTSKRFDILPILTKIDALQRAVRRFEGKNISTERRNYIYKRVGGKIAHLMYSSTDSYSHDLAYDMKPFHSIQRVKGKNETNTSQEWLLFYEVDFIRQRNRLIGEFSDIIGMIENEMLISKHE